jgi:hypothetical protein
MSIARWNGQSWSRIHPAEGVVSAVALDGRGTLVISLNNRVYGYSDTGWVTLGAYDGAVDDMAFDSDGHLYVAGLLFGIGDTVSTQVSLSGMARLNATTRQWEPLGGTIDGRVRDIAIVNNGIYIAGEFSSVDEVPAANIALYDIAGNRWETFGEGISSRAGAPSPVIFSLSLDSLGRLYVGGRFTRAGTADARNVAVWDGRAWYPIGSGVDSTVFAVAAGNEEVYVGGMFRTAGGVPSAFIARWDATHLSVDASQHHRAASQLSVAPNPASELVSIRVHSPTHARTRVRLYDQRGREVAVPFDGLLSAGDHVIEYDASTLPSGIYHCQVESAGTTGSTTLTVVR